MLISLKAKSLLWITGLILIFSGLIFNTFVFLRSSVGDLSDMIDVTVTANELEGLAGSVTQGLPADIEAFSLHPTRQSKQRIQNVFSIADQKIALLESKMKDEPERTQLNLVKNMFTSSRENFEEIEDKLKLKAPFAEVNALVTNMKESSGLISDSVQQLISQELVKQQTAKTKLRNRIDTTGYQLAIAITIFSVLGLILFYFYFIKRNVLLPLDNMKNTMSKIASDASDIKLRVRVEREDEIGRLAAYFNNMADTIQRYNLNLEELVDTRTRQLSEAQAMLVESGKLSALGEMAGGIAHEINTPLAVIQLNAHQIKYLLKEEPVDLSTVQEIAELIDTTVVRISKIVKGLRTFSRDASQDPLEMASLQEIIDNSLALCGEKLSLHGVNLTVSGIPVTAKVNCRPTELSQVFLNLVSNAYDAIYDLPEKWIDIRAFERGENLEIEVTDSGKGISAEIQDKVFHPFFTTKEVGKGTGLGLSTARGIVELLGGSLRVDSTCPNTRFVITLPRG